ncbi:hypothetical protein [Segniliparus rugosus]|uniref:Lipoprotein n=1 Tax=Segniliparus rugosus (strain ATCC BAA-974 / DSM 45345 / CCUG 50838 / CIP 108380 / JCM 13579 / CDC 945) TaxID=679197 RepID=E5XNG4_SEGRC|nr:hypothetical protein [Segniliparus rugosus]EFV14076.1 hypothetical protein HMPREF9336_00993 [Segniliparus rugosus ATCC BAA-974]
MTISGVRVGVAILTIALAATGCARQAATGGLSQSGRLAGLRDCAAASDGEKNVDCSVKASDKSGRVLEVTGSGPYKVEVFAEGGTSQQVLPPPQDDGGGHFGLPEFKDLDGDGLDEVLLPFGGGGSSGAREFEVWRASGPAARFADAGVISGQGAFRRTADGKFFGDYGRGGAGLVVFDFYRFAGGKAVDVLKLDVRVRHDGATGAVVGSSCSLSGDDEPAGSRAQRDAALKAAGLDPASAERAYCAEPWVRSVFSG